MKKDLRGRQACKLSPYHVALHEAAVARVNTFRELLAAGQTPAQVAQQFGITVVALKRAIERQERAR